MRLYAGMKGYENSMEIFAYLKNKYAGRTVYVRGHSKPDRDTVLSTELFCRFCRRFGIDAVPVKTGNIAGKVKKMAEAHGIDAASWLPAEEADGLWFLVDCHEAEVTGRIIGCIDHHPAIDAPDYEIYVNLPISSACIGVFRQGASEGIDVTADDEIMTVESVYADTQGTLSNKFDVSDRPWLDSAEKKYGLDREELKRLGLDFCDLTADPGKLAANGVRFYEFRGVRFAVSHVTAERIPDRAFGWRLAARLVSRCADENIYLWAIIISDVAGMCSELWEISEGDITVRRSEGMLSRSMDVVPELERLIDDKIRRGLIKNS